MQNVIILGSTGSIGCSTLDLIRLHNKSFSITALVAGANYSLLFKQCIEFNVKYAVLTNKDSYIKFKELLLQNSVDMIVFNSYDDIISIIKSTKVDIVVSAIVGINGLLVTATAMQYAKKVLLANKESLVIGGEFLLQDYQCELISVDSEHNAVMQCLKNERAADIKKIHLTASGGPFF